MEDHQPAALACPHRIRYDEDGHILLHHLPRDAGSQEASISNARASSASLTCVLLLLLHRFALGSGSSSHS